MKIAWIGSGKMARALSVVCAVEEGFEPTDLDAAEVILDFSRPENLDRVLEVSAGHPLVIGTTGYDENQKHKIEEAAQKAPIVWAANFSVGAAVMRQLVIRANEMLGEAFDVEIVETHHNQKKDAPSGTALTLARSIQKDRGVALDNRKKPGEIVLHALRGGTVTGEHRAYFFGNREELEIRHRAENREVFALGALRAAAFVAKAGLGLYDMDDVLFGGKKHGGNC